MPSSYLRKDNDKRVHTYETSIFFSSANVDFKSQNGSSFTVSLGTPIAIPKEAENVNLKCEATQIYNSVPNISEARQNNLLNFTIDGTPYEFTITKGLYTRQDLNTTITRLLDNEGLIVDNVIPFEILEDTATSRIVIGFNQPNINIDFTTSNKLRQVLGFDSRIVSSNDDLNAFGDNVARFNLTEFFVLTSSLCDPGMQFNDRTQNIIQVIPITREPGTNEFYEPRHPPVIDCQNLRGSKRNQVTFNLLDQNLEPVDTNGEDYSFRILLTYTM